MSRKEKFDPVEVARHSAERAKIAPFHGAADAEYALGFSNLSNFYGERVLLRGDITDRWTIAERMSAQDAEVVTTSVYDEGNPQKRPRNSSKIYDGRKFDRIAVANVGGFLTPDERVKEFAFLLNRTKFTKSSGRFGVTAFDFENFEIHAALSESATVRELGEFTKDFAVTTGLDGQAGRHLQDEVVSAVGRNQKLQVEVTANQRPSGGEDWLEIFDLLHFQRTIIQKALKGIPPEQAFKTPLVGSILQLVKLPNGLNLLQFRNALETLNERIQILTPKVEAVLNLPIEERPETEPPLIYRAVVTRK